METDDTEQPLVLPSLRQDLRLHEGPETVHGHATWLIYDPARHRYFNVPADVVDLLSEWSADDIDAFIERVRIKTGRAPDLEDLQDVVTFLQANNLTETPTEGGYQSYVQEVNAADKGPVKQAIHNYLFIRIPLFRPDAFLQRTLPLVRPLMTVSAAQIVFVITLLGLYLVSREWDEFTTTFLHFFTLEGALFYAVALMLVKTAHELGHAYAATRFGTRVSTMGIAFLLLLPLPYTDVTDTWRLKSRKQRLLIDGAGVIVELSVAGLMTFLWVFLPDGMLRSLAFVLATTSWILSLAVNLNPFMRFDGYYLLADAWGIANLQSRAFALARWSLRETLFGLGHPPPEAAGKRRARWMIAYGFGVWLYRLMLFIGIALIVYYYFFKVLGVFLFAVELLWFIALPIARELKIWFDMRGDIMKTTRTLITGCCLAGLVALAIIPWSTTVILPAVLETANENSIFTPAAGEISHVAVRDGKTVRKGDILMTMASPAIEHEKRQTQRRIAVLKARIDRRTSDRSEQAQSVVLREQLFREIRRFNGLKAEGRKLVLRAPQSGIVRNVMRDLHAGRWLQENSRIALVVVPTKARLTAYVSEENLWRLSPRGGGTFIPDDPVRPSTEARIAEIAVTGARTLDVPYLGSRYGGPIPVEKSADNESKPASAQYLVRFETGAVPAGQVLKGVIHVEGKSESFARGFMNRVMRVLIRETSI